MVTDSAGVRILTYDLTGVTVPTYAVLASAPELKVGSVDGAAEYALGPVSDLREGPDGTVLVVDGPGIRVYGDDGVYLRTLGRQGDGPGEFGRAPTIIGVCGDTVVAWEGVRPRVSRFLVSSRAFLDATTYQGESMGPFQIARMDDGSFLLQSRWESAAAAEEGPHDLRLQLDSVVVERLDAGLAFLDTVSVAPDVYRAVISMATPSGRLARMMMERPYTGRAFLRSDGARTLIGDSHRFEITSFAEDGTPTRILRVSGIWPSPSADAIRARMREVLEESGQGTPADPRAAKVYDEFLPERTPHFSRLLQGADGTLWVASYELTMDDGFDWLVFSSEGGLLGSVHTPPGLRVHDVGGGRVLGEVRDSLDVPYVQRYRLLPSDASEEE